MENEVIETGQEEIKEEAAELTEEEKTLVRNYAVNDPEVRRAIISGYIDRLKTPDAVPEVMQGGEGASPVFVPRAARDMREAAILAEALLKRK